jgi:hypothetical protein
MSQQASNDSVSPTGSISKSLSKPQGGFSTSKPLLSLQQTSFSKTKFKYIFKTTFQNILTMEEGFYHENPSIAASKILPLNWYYKPWNLAKSQSYYATILEITNYVKFKHFKLHSDHTELAYSTCIIHKVIHPKDWGQPLHQPLFFLIHFRTNPQDFNTSYTY